MMITSVSARLRSIALLSVLVCLPVLLFVSAVHGDGVTTLTGNPAPPVQVALGQPYDVAVQATPPADGYVVVVYIESNQGGPDGPSGNVWTNHGEDDNFSYTQGVTVSRTFHVVNQAYGYYYWRAGSNCYGSSTSGSSLSSAQGYFFTPYYY